MEQNQIDIKKAYIGMTRSQMRELFGEPTETGNTSLSYKSPLTYRYGIYEFGFEGEEEGRLVSILEKTWLTDE